MKLFEYEAKNILKENGITIPVGAIAASAEEAEKIAQSALTLIEPLTKKQEETVKQTIEGLLR